MSQDAGQRARDGDRRASDATRSPERAPKASGASRTQSRIAMAVAAIVVLLASAALIALLGTDRSSDDGLLVALTAPTHVAVPAPSPTVSAPATEQVVPPSSTPTRTPVPGPPYTVHIIADYVPYPPRVDHLVESSDLIVVGRVVEALPARWTTPDGVRPVDPFTMERQYTIITPALLEIEEVLFDRAGRDLDGARIIVATEGGHVGNDSVLFELPLEAGTRLFSVLSPYTDDSGEPVTLLEEPMWNPHTRYTLTAAGEPWRRPNEYGQCLPEDVPRTLAQFIGAFNLGDRDALGYLFPFTDHPGGLVEPHTEGGMQVFYGYAMTGEATGTEVYDGRRDLLIEHLLQRHAANERWYVQDLTFTENLDPTLQMPDVTHGTIQFIREADDLPATTMLADVWFNCLDVTIRYVRGWQAQETVATGSLIGSEYDVFPTWPEWMPDDLWQRTTVDATRWRPVELHGRQVEVVSYPNLNISGGFLFGDAGCDMYNIEFLRIAEGHVALGQYMRWESYCDDKAVEELEERFFAALQQVSTYRIVDGRLVFRNAEHEVVMVLERD